MYTQGKRTPPRVVFPSDCLMRLKLQSGVSLIEVLVTLVLVSIGLTGLMLTQAHSLHQNQSAYFRSQAIALAADISDRIRLNSDGALSDHYLVNIDQDKESFDYTAISDPAKRLAYQDLTLWLTWLTLALPDGDAVISRSDRKITINISWQGRRKDGNSSGYQHQVNLL